jgi:biotin transport system substrate-specific component
MKLTLREMILISIFAALTAVGAFIRIPTPIVPFTLQFLFSAYSGIFLGAKHGFLSQLLYVGIGLIGIPIFANGGGPTYVLQPTFGYLIGFMICAYSIGKCSQNLSNFTFIKVFSTVLLGLFLVYLCGVGYLYCIVNFYLQKQMSISMAIAAGFIPYITADLILSVLISLTAIRILPILKKSGYYKSSY